MKSHNDLFLVSPAIVVNYRKTEHLTHTHKTTWIICINLFYDIDGRFEASAFWANIVGKKTIPLGLLFFFLSKQM